MNPFGGFFGGMPPFFMIFFLFVIGMIIFSLVRSAANYQKNASSPILTEYATLISKRSDTRNSTSVNNGHHHNHSRTYYFVTFETEAGQRMELTISGREFGLLAEGDNGLLTYQGEWFKKFDRQ